MMMGIRNGFWTNDEEMRGFSPRFKRQTGLDRSLFAALIAPRGGCGMLPNRHAPGVAIGAAPAATPAGEDSLMTEPPPVTPPESEPGRPARPASLAQVIGAVLWSFFGVRKGDAMRRDTIAIKPHQVIIVGILIAAAFVVVLLIIVRVVTRDA
jgi:hypothetical protein